MTKYTDYGNAERLVRAHGQDLRYCDTFARWYCWEGTHWAADDTQGVIRAAKQTVRALYAQADAIEDADKRKALLRHAMASESSTRLKAMVWSAQSEVEVAVRSDDLDLDPWALNVRNGTLNLRTGDLRPHDRDDLITRLCPAAYDPHAITPTWVKFLDRVMDNDAELIAFLQRAVGYSLTGMTGEECLFVPYGTGANGKSKFLGAIHSLLGGYAQQLPRETLMARRRGGEIPNDIAALQGVRFATAIETRKGQRLDEELVKQLTGGDPVRARFLHAEYFEFKPVAKIWLATNARPKITGTDDGIWRRIRLVPFSVTIPESERDHQLAAKLEAELAGILAWAVQGCLEWQRRGLDPPDAVTDATAGYRREEDVLGDFLDQCCIRDETRYAYAKDLHDAYVEYTGERISQKELGTLLRERGFDAIRKGHGGRSAWLGLGVADPGEGGVG